MILTKLPVKAISVSVVLVLALFGVFVWFTESYDVKGIQYVSVTDNSLKEHKTSSYRMASDGFIVRRGWPFELVVTVKTPLENDQTIVFAFETDGDKSIPRANSTLIEYSGSSGHSYTLKVETNSNAPIGKYEKAIVYITNSLVQNFTDPFILPGPVYLIFNPYNKGDEVYCPDNDMRLEMIQHEYGRVYNGFANKYFSYLWFYAQFDELTLEAAFYLLSLPEMHKSTMNNASAVATYLSTNLGWYRKNQSDPHSPPVGNQKGLLEERWSDDIKDYPDGTDPEAWTSTFEILHEWKNTGKAAKYAQGYIYASIQNSLFRTLGIASRQISIFDARIDTSAVTYGDGKKHHIVNKYYDHSAKLVKSEGSICNFHSWTDIYLYDFRNINGLFAIDGTSPRTPTGPGPLQFVKTLYEDFSPTISDMISYVKSAERYILMNCSSIDMCEMEKVIKYDPSGVGLIVSSKPDDEQGHKDITLEYLDRTVDAYIPAPHDPLSGGLLQNKEGCIEFDISIKHLTDSKHVLILGSPVNVEVYVSISGVDMDEREMVNTNVAVVMELMSDRGEFKRTLASVQKELILDSASNQTTFIIPLAAQSSEYLADDVARNNMIEIRVIALTQMTNGDLPVAMKIARQRIIAPDFQVIVPPLVAATGHGIEASVFEVSVHYQNPTTLGTNRVCISLHTHKLRMQQHDQIDTNVVLTKDGEKGKACYMLASGQDIQVPFIVTCPGNLGLYTMAVSLTGTNIPHTVKTVQVTVVDKGQELN
eukprot:CFRG6060T1